MNYKARLRQIFLHVQIWRWVSLNKETARYRTERGSARCWSKLERDGFYRPYSAFSKRCVSLELTKLPLASGATALDSVTAFHDIQSAQTTSLRYKLTNR